MLTASQPHLPYMAESEEGPAPSSVIAPERRRSKSAAHQG